MPDPQLIWQETLADINQEIEIPHLFEESTLIVGLESNRLYFPAATISQYFVLPGIGATFIESKKCTSGNQLVYFSNVQAYRLRIKLTVNVRFLVSVWELANMPLVNPVSVEIPASKTSVIFDASVETTTTADTLIPPNEFRLGFTIWNQSTSALLIDFGAQPVTATKYALRIEPGGYYEDPYQFVGEVTGVWVAADANGAAKIRQFVE